MPVSVFASPWPNPSRSRPCFSLACERALRALFRQFDRDGSAGLSLRELSAFVLATEGQAGLDPDSYAALLASLGQRCKLAMTEVTPVAFFELYLCVVEDLGSEQRALERINRDLGAAGLGPVESFQTEPDCVDLVDLCEDDGEERFAGLSSEPQAPVVHAFFKKPAAKPLPAGPLLPGPSSMGMASTSGASRSVHPFFSPLEKRSAAATAAMATDSSSSPDDEVAAMPKRSRKLSSDAAATPEPWACCTYLPAGDVGWRPNPDFPAVPSAQGGPPPPPAFSLSAAPKSTARPSIYPPALQALPMPRLVDPDVWERSEQLLHATPPHPRGAAGGAGVPPPSDAMWTARYGAGIEHEGRELVSNQAAYGELETWLAEYQERPSEQERDEHEHESDWAWDDDDDGLQERGVPPVALLLGPCGSGKTQAVYKAAKQFGLTVFEVNSSEDRTGARLKALVGEASTSNQIKSRRDIGRPLVLIDEVDLAFDEDPAFAQALRAVIGNAKCPVVLTCNELVPGLSDDGVRVRALGPCRVVAFARPGERDLTEFLSRVLKREGAADVDATRLGALRDVRKALLHAQFWHGGGASHPPTHTHARALPCVPAGPPAAAPRTWTATPLREQEACEQPPAARVKVLDCKPRRAEAGAWIVVQGRGFAPEFEGDRLYVEIDGAPCREFAVLSDTEVSVRVPSDLALAECEKEPVPEYDSDLELLLPTCAGAGRGPKRAGGGAGKRRAFRFVRQGLCRDVVVGVRRQCGPKGWMDFRSDDDVRARHNGLFVLKVTFGDEEESSADKSALGREANKWRPPAPAFRLDARAMLAARHMSVQLQTLSREADELSAAVLCAQPRRRPGALWPEDEPSAGDDIGERVAGCFDVDWSVHEMVLQRQRSVAQLARQLGLPQIVPNQRLDSREAWIDAVPYVSCMAKLDQFRRASSVSRRFNSHFVRGNFRTLEASRVAEFGLVDLGDGEEA